MAVETKRTRRPVFSYKTGYVVYLRSGGPEMVIESIEPNGDLNCIWFVIGSDEKWEMPLRARFIARSVQLAVDGDMVDSRRGHFVDDDSYLVAPTEIVLFNGPSPDTGNATKPTQPPAKRRRF